jgi:predicted small secreted protein
MVKKSAVVCLAVIGPCLFLAGCSNAGSNTYRVTGTVTLDGQPLEEADILFLPLDPAVGPDAGQIRNGKFTFQAKAGSKRVEIRTSRPVRIKTAMGETTIWKNHLPGRYNTKTTLQAEVTPKGENDFTYQLHTAAD